MLITNMIWNQWSHKNSLIIRARQLYWSILNESAESQLVQTISSV